MSDAPLDLRDIEARWRLDDDEPTAFKYSRIGQEMLALLAALRKTRAALDEWLSPVFNERELAERRARSVEVFNSVTDELGKRR